MEGRSDVGVYGTVSFATPFRHAAIRDDRKVMASIAGIANLGTGDDSNCGGAETATQEERRAFAAFGMIGGGLGTVLLAQLRPGHRIPVDFRGIEQRADRGIGQPMRAQFGADAIGTVTMPHPRAHDHLSEAGIALIFLFAQLPDGRFRFFFIATRVFQPRAQFALRILASREHTESAVVGAAMHCLPVFAACLSPHGYAYHREKPRAFPFSLREKGAHGAG